MSKKRKFNDNFVEKCRICLCDDGFMSHINSISLRTQIEYFEKFTAINLRENGENLPNNICHVCLYKIDIWMEFNERFARSNETLRLGGSGDEGIYRSTEKRRKSVDSDAPLLENRASGEPENAINAAGDAGNVEAEKTEMSGSSTTTVLCDETPSKQAGSRGRGKTSERREASRKRWAARKKAILAATGENETDSDSGRSEDAENLSPVQKARKNRRKIDAEKSEKIIEEIVDMPENSEKKIMKNTSEMEKMLGLDEKRTIKSEIIVEGTTFSVTSILALVEKPKTKNCLEETQNSSVETQKMAQNATEIRNTDIIDAVQLRRVNPSKMCLEASPERKKGIRERYVEKCLHIEIESPEIEALERVQKKLAFFVEKKLSKKFQTPENYDFSEKTQVQRDKSLDEQLKTIVEKAIAKKIEIRENATKNVGFGEKFAKVALESKIFQPQVILSRFDEKNSPEIPESNEKPYFRTMKTRKKGIFEKKADIASSMENQSRPEVAPKTFRKIPEIFEKSPKHPETIAKNHVKIPISRKSRKTIVSTGEKHICGVCGDVFASQAEVESHFLEHKKILEFSNASNSTAEKTSNKRKMMRCKRCHEIVESQYVKFHMCTNRDLANRFKCDFCASIFRTAQQLEEHGKIHEKAAEKMPENDEKKKKKLLENSAKMEISENDDFYTCFICDQRFTDKEILKDHLQAHCDEMNEENEPITGGEKRLSTVDNLPTVDNCYQCAICDEYLSVEEALENHVEKHLFDEAEVPITEEADGEEEIVETTENLGESENSAKIHNCTECDEKFDSEMLLMLHVQAHEEDAEIEEWEKNRVFDAHFHREPPHICVICQERFSNEDDLSEHLDVHNGNTHVCLLCDRPFFTLEELQSHVNTH